MPDPTSLQVLALDNALGVTGYCTNRGVGTWEPPKVPTGATVVDRARRLLAYEKWLAGLIDVHRPAVIAIEGYGAGTRGQAAISMSELGWACRRTVVLAGVPLAVISPASLKKYATGKGNAAKNAVLAAAIRRLGYDGHDDNAADALWLWTMTFDWYSGTRVVPKAHAAALSGVQWPTIRQAQAAT